MKHIKYFFQSFIIYIFFIIIKILGLSIARNLFSFIFIKIGPLVRSNQIVEKNIESSLEVDENRKKK